MPREGGKATGKTGGAKQRSLRRAGGPERRSQADEWNQGREHLRGSQGGAQPRKPKETGVSVVLEDTYEG